MIDNSIAKMISKDSIVLVKNATRINVSKSDKHYETIYEMLYKKNTTYDIDDIQKLIGESSNFNISEQFKNRVELLENSFEIDGIPVDHELHDHILFHLENNLSLDPIVRFWDNLQSMPHGFYDRSKVWRDNPYLRHTKSSLFAFLKVHGYAITEDGCFIAEKSVNPDLSSIWDNGKTKHSIGVETSLDRWECDHNPNNSCSHGLHVRSEAYSWGANKTVLVVKVNPRDVVAIPYDYQKTDSQGNIAGNKMRVCAYVPIDLKSPDESLVKRFTDQDTKTSNIVDWRTIVSENMNLFGDHWEKYDSRNMTKGSFFYYTAFDISKLCQDLENDSDINIEYQNWFDNASHEEMRQVFSLH